MSLQWTAVATFLYFEVFVVLLLCIPFISPKRWQKVFRSRLVQAIMTYGNTYFVVLIVILVFLLFDMLSRVERYSPGDQINLKNSAMGVPHLHIRLFRLSRNLLLSKFSLLVCVLLRRLVTLVSQQATVLASNEAFKKQAEGASDAAKRYMEENEKLRQRIKSMHVQICYNLASLHKTLLKSENEVTAIKKQAEGLTKEYDRLMAEHAALQVLYIEASV
ncbi:B-cell receptor-associated protein 31 [Protopterus annectens]|uniref:B-cell receptor-associated protein 31 n=1 Tax=Protopterus annectens TaxID=7888 RepID=UPI001CF93648|nr:B-cell receptor-associated protein 31 [Protopterus annectens]